MGYVALASSMCAIHLVDMNTLGGAVTVGRPRFGAVVEIQFIAFTIDPPLLDK